MFLAPVAASYALANLPLVFIFQTIVPSDADPSTPAVIEGISLEVFLPPSETLSMPPPVWTIDSWQLSTVPSQAKAL